MNNLDFLQSLGLTNSEIQIYLALLAKGSCDAREVHRQASVPFGKVYDILYCLERKRLVIVKNTRPKRFEAVEPRLALKNLLECKEKEMQHLFAQAARVEEELKQVYLVKSDKSIFWDVGIGLDESANLVKSVFQEVEDDVLVYSSLATLEAFSTHLEGEHLRTTRTNFQGIFSVIDKNIGFRVLLGTRKPLNGLSGLRKNLYLSQLPRQGSIRLTPVITGAFILIDSEKVILDLRNPSEPSEHQATIYIWEKVLGKVMQNHFESMWRTARPVPLRGA